MSRSILAVLVTILMASPWSVSAQIAEPAPKAPAAPVVVPGTGQGSGLPLPRFVSLRAGEVNMRIGPGVRYPVDWVYRRQQLPVEVIAEFGTWRKVRDGQGTQGWIHQSMLSNRRSLLVTGQTRTLRQNPETTSGAVARLEPGVIGEILECPEGAGWCRINAGGYEGWLRRAEFWGAYPNEALK